MIKMKYTSDMKEATKASKRAYRIQQQSTCSSEGAGEIDTLLSDDERIEYDKEKAKSEKADDEEKHDDDEIADEEETHDERTESEKNDQEIDDAEKIDAEQKIEEKVDEEQTRDNQAEKDDQAEDDQVAALISVTQKENPKVPLSTSSHSLLSNYVIPTMTTPTSSTTPPTTEVQATTVTATNPSPAVLQRLLELEKKVEALSKVDYSEAIEESVQANVHNEVRNQIPNFLPKFVSEFVKPRLERTVRDVLKKKPINLLYLDESIARGDLVPNKVLKQKHGNDKDQDPPSDSAKEKKKKRKKDAKPSKKSSTSKESSKVKEPTPKVAMDAEEPILDDAVNDVDQPQDDTAPTKDTSNWFKQPPDLKPVIHNGVDPNADVGPGHTWFNDLEKAAKDPAKFNDLMGSTIDFLNFIKNRIKKDKITKYDLEGPVFKLLKGTCESSIKLEYHLEQRYLAFFDQMDWINPEGDRCSYDLSKPLPLQGHLSHLTIPILSVIKITVDKQLGYGYSEEIVVRRGDWQEYTFKEGDFSRLHLNDIEDMLLLHVQNKIFNLLGDDIVHLSVHKILHERLQNFVLRYNKDVPKRKWTDKDQNWIDIMVKKIDNQLLERPIMRSLEGSVGGRNIKTDYRLLQRIV
ncbi:hypothetical protein Tco_0366496 [Tanacetum coccineum]